LFSQKPQRIRYLYGLSSLQGRFVWWWSHSRMRFY
jgi:hypothetical protein